MHFKNLILSFFILFTTFSCSKNQNINCDSDALPGKACSKVIKLNGKINGYESFFYSTDLIVDVVRYDKRKSYIGKILFKYNSNRKIISKEEKDSKGKSLSKVIYNYEDNLLSSIQFQDGKESKYNYNDNRLVAIVNYDGLSIISTDSLLYYENDSIFQINKYNENNELIGYQENIYFSNHTKKTNYYDSNSVLVSKSVRVYERNKIKFIEYSNSEGELLNKITYSYENEVLVNVLSEDFETNIVKEEIYNIIGED